MVDYAVDACRAAGIEDVMAVISPLHPELAAHLEGHCAVLYQAHMRGTGDAVRQVPDERLEAGDVVVLNGDQPLFRGETIARLIETHRGSGAAATLATVRDRSRPDGRVIRGPDGSFDHIVEHRDATPEERACDEINTGLYCFRGPDLVAALGRLQPDNAQGEYYLTDVFRTVRPVEVLPVDDPDEGLGINDRVQLATAEGALRRRVLIDLMRAGVTVIDPTTTYVDAGVRIGCDTVLEPMTVLRGRTVIGERCRIGPGADITDSVLEDDVVVTRSWLQGARMGKGSDCGPFSKLRPGTDIAAGVHIGSFAEVVRSRVGVGSKVPHFSYLGDTTVGERVNVAAGTITANYDGTVKSPTVIEDGVFIGVDTMLVAPVRVGAGSRTGAGAVVTRDVPPGTIAVGMPARALRRSGSPQDGSATTVENLPQLHREELRTDQTPHLPGKQGGDKPPTPSREDEKR